MFMDWTSFSLQRSGGFAWFDLVSNAAVKQERGDNRLRCSVLPKYLTCNHGRGFAPVQRVTLVGVVLAEIDSVRARQNATHPLTRTLEEVAEKERWNVAHRRIEVC